MAKQRSLGKCCKRALSKHIEGTHSACPLLHAVKARPSQQGSFWCSIAARLRWPSACSHADTSSLGVRRRVQDLFHSVQLNVNNPHFLIMQGMITKVSCLDDTPTAARQPHDTLSIT